MAKSGEGNFFLLHVEKLVLAGCLAVLAATIFAYPMQDLQVTLDQQPMHPAEVDDYLLKLLDRKIPPDPPDPPDPNYGDQVFLAMNKPAEFDDVGELVPPGPVIPEPTIVVAGSAKLDLDVLTAAMQAPTKPMASINSEFLDTDPYRDSLVAHATALFNYKDLLQKWRLAMTRCRAPTNLVLLDVIAERRESVAGKFVGEPVPVKVSVRLPVDKDGKAIDPSQFEFAGDNNMTGEELQAAIQQYHQSPSGGGSSYEQLKVEPDFWHFLGTDRQWQSWRAHLPVTGINVVVPAGGTNSGTPPPGPTIHQPVTPGPGPMPGPGTGIVPSGPGRPGMTGGPMGPGGYPGGMGRPGGMGGYPPTGTGRYPTGPRPGGLTPTASPIMGTTPGQQSAPAGLRPRFRPGSTRPMRWARFRSGCMTKASNTTSPTVIASVWPCSIRSSIIPRMPSSKRTPKRRPS